jgi:cold shock CspA family protein
MCDTTSRILGRVKWFNNKVGYGFVSVTEGDNVGKDIFVHHSVIQVTDQQYRYLVQGEYVELDVSVVEGGKYEYQASLVMGVRGGKLMCETRNESKQARNDYFSNKINHDDDEPSAPVQRRRGGGPRDDGWTQSGKKAPVDTDKKRGRPVKVHNSTTL